MESLSGQSAWDLIGLIGQWLVTDFSFASYSIRHNGYRASERASERLASFSDAMHALPPPGLQHMNAPKSDPTGYTHNMQTEKRTGQPQAAAGAGADQ